MAVIAKDSNNNVRLLLVDEDGKLILGEGSDVIGSVNEARGKTLLFRPGIATAGTTTMRTVTAGKTFYLAMAGLMYSASVGNVKASIKTSVDSTLILQMYSHITATYHTQDSDHAEITFPHPIPIAAGVEIQVYSSNAGITANGWIIGWEE